MVHIVLTINSNADIGLLQRWGVVDAITSHANHVMSLLQHLHDHELVLWEHLGKAICLLNQVFGVFEAFWHTLALLCLCAPACRFRHTEDALHLSGSCH